MKHSPLPLALALAFSCPTAFAKPPQVASVEFTSTPAPRTEAEMTSIYTRSTAVVSYADGTSKSFPLRHHTLFKSGDRIGSGVAGLVVDRAGRPVDVGTDENGNLSAGPFHAYAPDANSLIRLQGRKGEELFLVTHYEYHTESPAIDGKGAVQLYGRLPAGMSLTRISQDGKDGMLTARSQSNIDMSTKEGLWIPCAGSLTPWNTHLGGEEYEPNAQHFEHAPLEPMNLYRNTPGKHADEGGADPYRYGGIVEVTVKAGGSTEVRKRFAMGRLSAELAEMMPDERTAYMGDDGRDTLLLMFVADRPRDLSAGTLYAARWEQLSAESGGEARLHWIRLGHAEETEIKALVDRGIRFSDIFEVADGAAVKAAPDRHADFKPVFAYAGIGGSAKPAVSWLRIKPGMEQAAAFLETRRYAALLGATTEFTKMEGVTHNAADRKLYLAMSYIEGGMLDGKNGDRPRDDIRLSGDAKDLACGAVYEAQLGGDTRDQSGNRIDSGWVARSLRGMLLGAKKPFGQPQGPYDKCDTERPANPDNLKYSAEMRTLFIGEDSGNHLNNFLWAYNVDSGNLARILSAPAGAEHTGLAVATNVNGKSYIFGNVQHPGASDDLKSYPDAIKVKLRAAIDQRGSIGYIGGLPELRRP